MLEIKLPEAKPAFEWVNGRTLQKVSPKFKHGLAQLRFAAALDVWARKKRMGSVATEWRFHIQPPEEIRRPLVRDVTFLSYKRLPYAKMLLTQNPQQVVEVLSPRDRRADIDEKVRVYLTAGSNVVFLVDPTTQTVTVCDGTGKCQLHKRDIIHHSSLPGFRLAVKSLFVLPKPK
jgi:Uma2 family endonuclease